ncbi:MAG: pyruvate formate lyase family protein [Kiritimatiellae bacterium]|nr:pyruvate formate lyase family protein [Kiritimatiellia bacterium]
MSNKKPSDAARIAALRERCLDRKASMPAASWSLADFTAVTDAEALRQSEGLASWQRRIGLRTRARLEKAPLTVDDLELLAGRLNTRPSTITASEVASAKAYLAAYTWPGGQNGHCALDFRRLFEAGVGGVMDDVRARMADAHAEGADTLASFLDALEGLTALIGRVADTVEATAAGAPAWRRAELAEMAAICRHVQRHAPRSFREALQLLWLTNLAVEYADTAWLVCPGRLDRVLRPFYDADLRAGTLTREHALLLIESLYLQINNFVPDGLAVAVMTGGTDAAGADVTHELSYLCLEALRRTKLVYPTVGVCWHPGTPRELSMLACELIAAGYATPAFFNDQVIREGLGRLGLPAADACNYINSTCVEITPVGRSNVWVASPYFSLCRYLLDEIAAQAQATPPTPDFESFLAGYFSRLAAAIHEAVEGRDGARQTRQQRRQYGGKPLQSVFTRDCIARARDIDAGGALTNWVECSFVGIANLADSLEVIRAEVFESHALGFAELKRLLDDDFSGREDLRLRFLNCHPKYGNAVARVDALVARVAEFFSRECARYSLPPDESPFVPGTFCWVNHERLGAQCGATPDGRRRGEPFADGGGPAQGREQGGPTHAILSTTSWDHTGLIGGLAFNMKFAGSLFSTPEAIGRLHDLVLTFLQRGGFETQINVVSRATLEAAERKPEQYRDLVVRIGGYTDYFVRLSPGMRQEVMRRTEYEAV